MDGDDGVRAAAVGMPNKTHSEYQWMTEWTAYGLNGKVNEIIIHSSRCEFYAREFSLERCVTAANYYCYN